MLSWIFIVSCSQEPQPTSDHDRYLKALTLSTPQAALEECQKITRVSTRGECILFAAKTAVENRLDGVRFCEASPNQSWRSACLFEVADISGATGKNADHLCQQTGTFAKRCFYHALQREENQLMQRFPLGEEKKLIQSIQDRLNAMGIEELKDEPLSETLCSRIIAKRFLMSWTQVPTMPFRYASCGKAPKQVCDSAYRFILKLREKKGVKLNCNQEPSLENAVKLGFPSWDLNFDNAAQKAWANTCNQHRTQNQKPPDYRASQAQ